MHYRWFEKDQEKQDEFGLPKSRAEQQKDEDPPKNLFSRGEITGIVLSSVLLIYSLALLDIPILLFSAAFLLQVPRKFAARAQRPWGHELSNLLKGFSISLFFGALLLLLL